MANEQVEFILKARDEATKVVAGAQHSVEGLTGALGNLASKAGTIGIVAGAIAGIAGGLVAAGKHFADTVEGLDRLSTATGIALPKLQEIHEAFERMGKSSEDADKSLGFLARAIARGDPLLKTLGITTRDVNEAALQLGDAFRKIDDPATKQQLALKLLGKGSSDLIDVYQKLREEQEAVARILDKVNGKLRDDAVRAARELDKELDNMSTAWHGLVTRFTSDVVPWAMKIIIVFESVSAAVAALASQFALMFDLMTGKLDFFDRQVRRTTIVNLQKIIGGLAEAMTASLAGVKLPPELTPEEPDPDLTKRAAAAVREGGGGKKQPKAKERPIIVGGTPNTTLDDLQRQAMLTEEADKMNQRFIASLTTVQTEVGAVAESFGGAHFALEEWRNALDDMLSTFNVTGELIGAGFRGLQNAASNAFAQITARWQYSANLLNNIMHSLVDSMLEELARLAAAEAFHFFLDLFKGASLITGGPASISSFSTGSIPDRAGRPRVESAINVHVTAIDAQSVYRSLADPNGALRLAFEDAALRGGM